MKRGEKKKREPGNITILQRNK